MSFKAGDKVWWWWTMGGTYGKDRKNVKVRRPGVVQKVGPKNMLIEVGWYPQHEPPATMAERVAQKLEGRFAATRTTWVKPENLEARQ